MVTFEGPVSGASDGCKSVLRSLPLWFGIESSLLQYVRDTELFPTFVATRGDEIIAFLTVRQHFPQAWEVHCIAVHAEHRRTGVGRALHAHVEQWLFSRGARLLQVKTLADTHPSPEYAETRRFYESLGYVALEAFPELWAPRLPVLQLVKALSAS